MVTIESKIDIDDKVYFVHNNGRITEYVVNMICYTGVGLYYSWRLNSGIPTWRDGFIEDNINKTVFLTLEDAKNKSSEYYK